MTALGWVRLDSQIGSHDKILELLAAESPKRWQAAFSYCCALGWSALQDTDGRIPRSALTFVHGTPGTAQLLVTHRLWDEVDGGWMIHNYLTRQMPAEARARSSRKANCVRWHGSDCGCWKDFE
jgi:hypothetical protein